MAIPRPTISRLCKIYSLLEELSEQGQDTISSNEIGKRLGVGPHNIRKDMTYIGEAGTTGSGYAVQALKDRIGRCLGFDRKRRACIVGLGKMGSAILSKDIFFATNFDIVAGFDSNINRLETLKINIPLYPTYDIPKIISRENIELALITVSCDNPIAVTEKLIAGGIRGIVNFSSTVLSPGDGNVYISNIDMINEFRFLSALFTTERDESPEPGDHAQRDA